MAHGYIECDRAQQFLIPPSLDDWLPQDHLARFVVDVVDAMDLSGFFRRKRKDGKGRAAYDPKTMVTLLLYAYCTGVRSSRMIERRCQEDIAFRFITAAKTPDHATVARFRHDHEKHIKVLFIEALRLCAEAGLVKVGLVALDGTKVAADASLAANRTKDAIEKEVNKILSDAAAIDAQEKRDFGNKRRGDELPTELADRAGRLARLGDCKKRLESKDAARHSDYERKAARVAEHQAQTGKRPRGRPPKPPEQKAQQPHAAANVTDPDSRIMKTQKGFIQGYNAQAVATENQIVIAAEVTQDENDLAQLQPMIVAVTDNLKAAGANVAIGTLLADAGYFTDDNVAPCADGPELLIATIKDRKQRRDERPAARGRIPKGLTSKQRMERKLTTKRGRKLYKKRSQIIEPVFGQHRMRDLDHFMRRGRDACDAEWKLENAAHNLLKLWRSGWSDVRSRSGCSSPAQTAVRTSSSLRWASAAHRALRCPA